MTQILSEFDAIKNEYVQKSQECDDLQAYKLILEQNLEETKTDLSQATQTSEKQMEDIQRLE